MLISQTDGHTDKHIKSIIRNVTKKKFFIRTEGRTDTRSTQKYSSEPHKTHSVLDLITYFCDLPRNFLI